MKFIYNKCDDSYFNLAAEEYLVKNSDEDIFMLWQNKNTIVVGRNQNTLEEINYDYVRENGIKVVRRMSGGGAVFHDMGNINFTFIIESGNDFSNYEKFTSPIIGFLNTLGVRAQLSGRNDITIDGKKISGNAQYMYKNRILHHGTLLFSENKDKISEALKVSEDKIKSKGIKSIRSRITNISEHLDEKMTSEEFIGKLFSYMEQNVPDFCRADLDSVHDEIEKLRDEKYARWEWNYGFSPKYDYRKKERFSGGSVEVCMNVSGGVIEDIKIYGDFFSKKNISGLEDIFKGCCHEYSKIKEKAESVDISEYISSVNSEEFLSLFF